MLNRSCAFEMRFGFTMLGFWGSDLVKEFKELSFVLLLLEVDVHVRQLAFQFANHELIDLERFLEGFVTIGRLDREI